MHKVISSAFRVAAWPGILLLALCSSLSFSALSQIRVGAIFCDNREDPVGIHPGDLFFSWVMESPAKGVSQRAYRLAIASSAHKLETGEFDVYDSRRVESDQSIQVHYKGRPLEEARTYYWKVMVWDEQRRASDWSRTGRFTTGIFRRENWQNACWIACESMPAGERVVPFVHGKMKEDDPRKIRNAASPLLRKEFRPRGELRQALLFISGLGHYEASLNGRRIGNAFLAPGWTFYDKSVLYNTYDVTAHLRQGTNVLGVHLGNGFYHVSQERYVKGTGAFGKPKMIAMLKLSYADGGTEYVVSDTSWKVSLSPVSFNNIYGGEDYDARLEQDGWSEASFDDKGWAPALEADPPPGRLLPETDHPVRFMDSLTRYAVKSSGKGIVVYDFGQNVSGIPQIRLRGKAGQQVRIIPAELLDDSGRVLQADGVSPHYYVYTLKGVGEEVWQPRFTYFALRYVQVEGVAAPGEANPGGLPVLSGLKVLHNRNSSPSNGSFRSSSEYLNRIHSLIDWAVKSNLQSYITDNPQREKLSWQGEQNFMRVAINYNYDVYNLYRSLFLNMQDAQHPGGLVPDIAPEYMQFEGPFVDSPEWGTTAILNSWFLYKYYGDTAMIRKSYPMMTRYAGHLQARSENHLLLYGLNDWLDVGGLTPLGITATAYYYKAIDALARMAAILGEDEDSARYARLAASIRKAFNDRFFDAASGVYGTGSQTAMAMPLAMGIVEDRYRGKVLARLLKDLEDSGYVLTAGDVGHRYLVKALFENGHPEALYRITMRDDVPGYGYQLKKGATALAETWDGRLSQNQLAMGHILEWFHGGIGGISQETNSVAFKHSRIRPQAVGELSSAAAAFRSPYGWIRSEWSREGDRFLLEVEIPVNTRANVCLPAGPGSRIYVDGKRTRKYRYEAGYAVLELGSGKYECEVR